MILIEPQVPDAARLPITKAAKALGVCRQTLTTKINDGLIRVGYRRATKTTSKAFIYGSELKRYWRSHT